MVQANPFSGMSAIEFVKRRGALQGQRVVASIEHGRVGSNFVDLLTQRFAQQQAGPSLWLSSQPRAEQRRKFATLNAGMYQR
jgi:hypothetical protein